MHHLFFSRLSDGSYRMTMASYTIIAIILLVILLMIATRTKGERKISVKQLTFSAVGIALAFVLSFIKVFTLPTGGSITFLSMFFVVLIGYWFGLRVGLVAAIAYGLLQLIAEPYILSLPQLLIDYPIAFGALGLSGLFSNAKHGLIKGYLLGIIGRYLFATLSGVIFFGSYAQWGWKPLPYSLAYNASYIFAEGVITIVVISIPPVRNALVRIKNIAVS